MELILMVLTVLLLIIDVIVFVKLCKIIKEHTHENTLEFPAKKIFPYVLIMAVVSVMVPIIGICLRLI